MRQGHARGTAFLPGKSWASLAAYVTDHRLVSADEVISVMAKAIRSRTSTSFPAYCDGWPVP